MNRFLSRTANSVLKALTLDEDVELFLGRTLIEARRNSRFWGI